MYLTTVIRVDLWRSPTPFDSTYNDRNMPVGAQFECLIKELGRKQRCMFQESLMLFYGSFGGTDKRVGRIKENVDSGNAKFKFRCILFCFRWFWVKWDKWYGVKECNIFVMEYELWNFLLLFVGSNIEHYFIRCYWKCKCWLFVTFANSLLKKKS